MGRKKKLDSLIATKKMKAIADADAAKRKTDSLVPAVYDRTPQAYYMRDVNINYSFSSLENLARKLGANLDVGDVLVVDNPNKTRRKIFKKTVNAALILYVGLLRQNLFDPLKNRGNGKIEGQGQPLAHYSSFTNHEQYPFPSVLKSVSHPHS